MLEKCHRKIEELYERLKQLESENRLLLTQKSQEELERIQLKKQSLTLNLKNKTSDVQTDTLGLKNVNGVQTTETETCDTFHTANSDCSFASALPSPFPPRQDMQPQNYQQLASTPDDINESSTSVIALTEDDEEEEGEAKTIMSDSGVCLDNNNKVPAPQTSSSSTANARHSLANHTLDGDNLSTNSSQTFYEQLLHTQMEKLREKVATKKAEIMRILEMGGEKSQLDEMINVLQELQKDYVKLEMRLENSRGMHFHFYCFHS